MTQKLLILVILLLMSVPVFAQDVDTAWVRRYNGPGDSTDFAHAIAVDGSGNVYVTGGSYGSGTSLDYATIKYYASGDTAWMRIYNGPGNGTDLARAIAVDRFGNVYVTGYSYGSGTGSDYTTVKYDSSGNQLWVRRYNGPGNSTDDASATAVDSSGNVYVTGLSYDSETSDDYTTIKYYPDGDTAWVRRYNGPGNSGDLAFAITVDGSNNVYVTGSTADTGVWPWIIDYATIKYYSNGDTAWVRRYDGPGNLDDNAWAISVDGSGNVFVTGESEGSGTSDDYATIKYYPNGDTAWVRRYNGPGNGFDDAFAISVDGSGNVYVTGRSYGSGTSLDYATIKYDPNGTQLWVRRYDGPGNSGDQASAITVDSSNNVYVTGCSHASDTSTDYATIKYDPNGNELWVKRYGPPGKPDGASAIAVDGFNNVYVTGRSSGSRGNDDYATIKYVQFLCGDVNKDGVVGIDDVVYLINYLFNETSAPDPIQAGDVNLDGGVNVVDVVYLINYLFLEGPPPCS